MSYFGSTISTTAYTLKQECLFPYAVYCFSLFICITNRQQYSNFKLLPNVYTLVISLFHLSRLSLLHLLYLLVDYFTTKNKDIKFTSISAFI